uniref:Scarecrow transcription factor family protein n=1 Tax=Rhizophora mucronata TaxID=61149 RepID=A0A2P2K9I9_RHIMU
MRVPVSPAQHNNNNHNNHCPNPKPVSCNSSNDSNSTGNSNRSVGPLHASNTPNVSSYEPTSVLDLRRSPSPARAGKPAPASDRDPLEWVDDHVLQTLDWESIMRELDFHVDDSAPSLIKSTTNFPQLCETQIHHQNLPDVAGAPTLQLDSSPYFHCDFNDIQLNSAPTTHNHSLGSLDSSNSFHNTNNWNVGFDFIQELILAADCFDSNQLQLADAILERLNQRMQSPVGKPLQRAAFFFKEALQSLLLNGSTRQQTQFSSWSDVVQTIRAYKAFSGISPIPMFTHFTTDQALLESLEGSPPFIHVIDFDIGLGWHYPSLMRELAEKADSPLLRITAMVTEDCASETKLIKESLSQLSHELRIRFQIEFVLLRTFELLSFKAVKFMEREKTAVLLSPAACRRLGLANNLALFVMDLRRVSPNVVFFVDSEGWLEHKASFRRNFVNGLEFYSLMLDSLDAAVAGGDWVRKIEVSLLKPRIFAAVEGCGRRSAAAPWREAFYRAGMRPVQLSQFADFQAGCLLEKVQVRGFHVARQQAELVLCWHERPLVATSAWKCR